MGVSPPNFSGAGVLALGVRPQREPLRTWRKALSQGAASEQGDSHSPARCGVKLHTLASLFLLRPMPCEGWLWVQETSGQCFNHRQYFFAQHWDISLFHSTKIPSLSYFFIRNKNSADRTGVTPVRGHSGHAGQHHSQSNGRAGTMWAPGRAPKGKK